MERNEKFLSIYPLPALLTPISLIPISTEKITGCTNNDPKGATPRNLPSWFFISCFTISVTPSINICEYSISWF